MAALLSVEFLSQYLVLPCSYLPFFGFIYHVGWQASFTAIFFIKCFYTRLCAKIGNRVSGLKGVRVGFFSVR